MIEVTEEQIHNAMLMPGEYTEKDGKFHTKPGMLDGYIETDEFPVSYLFTSELSQTQQHGPGTPCDICGRKQTNLKKCNLCGKRVCYNCYMWFDSTGCGECLNSYCIECWELGAQCRFKIENTIKKFNDELERLEKEWADVVNKNMKEEASNG